ncbi:unnamed protein product [Parnassius apollo]|uniref:(apollo) hypothetical protein n=1 Tax=Parnassius apollo TaxID=110799 RepID=A0A8S3XPF0_PARAO|nr:unnamed protein product [Parnassius apollo]
MTVLHTNAVPFVAKEPVATVTAAPVNVLKNTDCNVMVSTSKAKATEVTMTAAAANTNLMASTSKGTSQDYRLRALQSKLNRTIKQSVDRLKKLRALRERNRRLAKKVANLENVIAELKVKPLYVSLSTEHVDREELRQRIMEYRAVHNYVPKTEEAHERTTLRYNQGDKVGIEGGAEEDHEK